MDLSSSYEGPIRSVSFSDIGQSNEMLNAENASIRERVYELERKVQSQEDELVCLRSSTADLLRRLTILEQSASQQSFTQRIAPSHTNDVFSRLSATSHSAERARVTGNRAFSQSTCNLRSYNSPPILANGHRTISPSPIRRSSVESGTWNGCDQETHTTNVPRRYMRNGPARANIVNISTGRSARGSPMRKWMSNVDMKESNNNNIDHLRSAPKVSAVNNSSIQMLTLSNSAHNAKSLLRLGSLNSLAASHRSLSQLGCNVRDPVYFAEQRMLQVFIRGKPVMLTVPDSVDTINPLRELDAPKKGAQLEWVHGYRGKDSRGNLHKLPTGELVYFTGAVVVLHNVDEGTQRHYTQHTSEIKCIAIHPNKLHIATGQTSRHSPEKKILNEHRSPICSPSELGSILEADQTQAHVRVWDSVTLQTLRILGTRDASFEKGISCVAFSRTDGGTLLAAIDDSFEHTLSVWDWQRRKRLTETKSANDQVFACEFHPLFKNVIVSFGKGHFNFWTFDDITLSKKPAVFEGRDKPKLVLSICFTENGYVASGDSNGTISLWDPKTIKIVKQAFKVHDGGVWALCSIGGGRIVSGGKDRSLIEWNVTDLIRIHGPTLLPDDAGIIRTIAPASGSLVLVGTTRNSILRGDVKRGFHYVHQGHADELWALCAHPSTGQFLSGSIDGTLRLWDSLSKAVVWSMQIQEGVSCVDFHCSGNIFAVGTPVGSWIVYDTGTRDPVLTIAESTQPVSNVRFSPNGKLVAIATKESHFYLYSVSENLHRFTKTTQFSGFASFITALDWSVDGNLIRTNNNDFEQHIWCVPSGRLAETNAVRDASWSSSRCLVSFENGCITQNLPGVMAIERSPDSTFVAVAIDNGAIRFYEYPTTTVAAAYKEIFGHSAFIANLAFLSSRLISIGARDAAIFQWRL
uniref:HELP domain-containing protein n=1 Tax=Parascaris univalens TaxID=6257 RepID=A0A914ZJU4_PARUN